jgi:chromosomal replication initiation ATPase DnaA
VRPLDPQHILNALCQHYGVTREELAGDLRRPVVVWCRWLAAYIMHEHCRLSYPKIARLVMPGRIGHNTMLMGARKIQCGIEMAPRAMVVCTGGRRIKPFIATAELDAVLGLLGRKVAA